MTEQRSVSCWTAGRWSGSTWSLNDPIQQIAENYQVREGYYNAGTHNGFGLNSSIPKHWRWVGPYMRKRQRRKSSTDSHIELSVAENFWDVVRICHFRILQLIGHNAPQTDTTLVKAEKPKEACSEMVNST